MVMKNMESHMKHDFAKVNVNDWPRSRFRSPQAYKTMIDSGKIYPFLCEEVLPGDLWELRTHAFGRLVSTLVPFMDNLYLDIHYFFVPNRLVWDNWQAFMGEREDPADDPSTYTVPVVTCPSGGWAEESLADYFGLPTKLDDADVNALPFRAHNLVHKWWFRDQNLIDGSDFPVNNSSNGPDTDTDYDIYRRGKRHDYFTSCLPWPQKNATAVSLPLSGDAPITGLGNSDQVFTESGNVYETDGSGTTNYSSSDVVTQFRAEEDPNNSGYINIRANLAAVTAASINDLRESIAFQQAYEIDARGGTRYNEAIKAHWGVNHPTEGYRPEFLASSSAALYQTPVPNTSDTTGAKQGDLTSYSSFSENNSGFVYGATEHGWILGYMSIRSDLTYSQGIHKKWTRSTKFDHYMPVLANLGEQAVLNKEIYYADNPGTGASQDEGVFGYQERWAEYRYGHSLHTGALRHNYTGTLNKWHLGQEFSSLPTLGQTFIEETPPVSRVVAVTSQPEFVMDLLIDKNVTRVMPMYSEPGLYRV